MAAEAAENSENIQKTKGNLLDSQPISFYLTDPVSEALQSSDLYVTLRATLKLVVPGRPDTKITPSSLILYCVSSARFSSRVLV